ncbi:MAG: Glyoxalase/bleomycin resistance protein/dioxygenase [Planctomycetota bacterium]|nr:Glyoxalase/bleomycin resistance protein/dioxygenase [Planctomycetota bacterium]
MESPSSLGRIGWIDLSVPNAGAVRDFYQAVVGWTTSEVPMGAYSDYCVHPQGEATPVAGICHARGENAKLPPVWLIYVNVPDIDASLSRCVELGGAILDGPRSMGGMGRFAAIRDPAGAVMALFEPKRD